MRKEIRTQSELTEALMKVSYEMHKKPIDWTEVSRKWEELCSYVEEGLMSLTENILKQK